MTIARINQDTCIGCGECVLSCPMDVLKLDQEIKKSSIVFPEDCQTCWLCYAYCPSEAITISPVKCARPMVGWG